MTIDPDTLTNDELAALDPSSLPEEDQQLVMEDLNDRLIDDTPPPVMPDTDPPPSLDPTPVATGMAPDGTGWVITFDPDGAVRTTFTEDL